MPSLPLTEQVGLATVMRRLWAAFTANGRRGRRFLVPTYAIGLAFITSAAPPGER
jgi:hypothetical protein